jgi:hypothetical protein
VASLLVRLAGEEGERSGERRSARSTRARAMSRKIATFFFFRTHFIGGDWVWPGFGKGRVGSVVRQRHPQHGSLGHSPLGRGKRKRARLIRV